MTRTAVIGGGQAADMAAPTGATPSGHGAPEAATAVVIDLNGHATTVAVRADEAAVTVIRERCGLTGTKYVCGTGVCGACTVPRRRPDRDAPAERAGAR